MRHASRCCSSNSSGVIPNSSGVIADMCGRDGQYSALATSLVAKAAPRLVEAKAIIRDLCNKAGSFSSVPFTVDCAAIVGAGKVLSGSAGSYTVGTVTINNFPAALDLIRIGDPGVAAADCLETSARCR